jgi:hypothetical protein
VRIPRKLVVNGKPWTVRLKDLSKKRLEGQCDYRHREIGIDVQVPESERAEVFLHELLHACLEESSWSPKTEEFMVRRLAPRLLEALRELKNLGWEP